ncbi:ELAV-like protein 2 isoform X2 [Festucalex cinctus]
MGIRALDRAGNRGHGNAAVQRVRVQQQRQQRAGQHLQQLLVPRGVGQLGGQQDQPDRQLPASEHGPGGAQELVRQHRRDRVLQARPGQDNWAEPRLWICQLCGTQGCGKSHQHLEWPETSDQDHQGVLRASELRLHPRCQFVCQWLAEDHDADGTGAALLAVRPHHHLAHPGGPGDRSFQRRGLHPLRPSGGGRGGHQGTPLPEAARCRRAHHGQVCQQPQPKEQPGAAVPAVPLAQSKTGQPAQHGLWRQKQVLGHGHRRGEQPGGHQHPGPQRRLVHLRVQPGPRRRREHPVANVRAVRRRHQRQGHPRLQHKQVQRLRLRHHDQLRRGGRGHRQPERLPPGRPRAAGVVQDQQNPQSLTGRTRARVQQPLSFPLALFVLCSRAVSSFFFFCLFFPFRFPFVWFAAGDFFLTSLALVVKPFSWFLVFVCAYLSNG